MWQCSEVWPRIWGNKPTDFQLKGCKGIWKISNRECLGHLATPTNTLRRSQTARPPVGDTTIRKCHKQHKNTHTLPIYVDMCRSRLVSFELQFLFTGPAAWQRTARKSIKAATNVAFIATDSLLNSASETFCREMGIQVKHVKLSCDQSGVNT